MKLALHQPYFFPYIGYFTVLKNVDIYVHSDTMQYIRHGWINRNRILSSNGEWKYIVVPIKKQDYTTKINEVQIDYNQNWQKKMLGQLENYRKTAPFFHETRELVCEVIEKKYDNIAELNINSVKCVLDYLHIKQDIYRLSELNIEDNKINEPDEWGIAVSKAFANVTEYWNAPGGKEFYDVDKYNQNDLKIAFVKSCLKEYPQKRGKEFVPGLSVLDVMMYNTPEEIRQMLDCFYTE